ncbi:MAG: radical SAM protein [Desulfobacterales bacterium]|nr:radical SAM protein [Desulfobacterales bacterium]
MDNYFSPRIITQSFPETFNIGQCEACSPMVFITGETGDIELHNGLYKVHPALIEQPVNSSYFAILSQFARKFSVLNESAMAYLQYFKSPKRLEQLPSVWHNITNKSEILSILRKMVMCGILVPESYVSPYLFERSETLSVWLHVTDQCNLRCQYCYLPHKNEDMSIETGYGAIEATFRSAVVHDYQKVKLKYAGGEPLLKFPFILKLHQYAQDIANKRNMLLEGIILSNGTLLSTDMIEKINSLGLRLMISLDGMGFFHNQQRAYSTGQGTFNDVIRVINLALNAGLVPDISVTVTSKNIIGLPELVYWLLERKLPFGINFYRKKDKSQSNLDLEEQKIVNGMLEVFKIVEANLPDRILLTSLIDRANLAIAHLRACSVGHSYMVFDCYGRISKCQIKSGSPVTTFHANDPLAVIRADETGINNISVEDKEECRSCLWKYLCAGGCPLDAFMTTDRFDVKSSNCTIYKRLFPEVLRLEGLRLLKYYNPIRHLANNWDLNKTA